jgi:hypothetical protein
MAANRRVGTGLLLIIAILALGFVSLLGRPMLLRAAGESRGGTGAPLAVACSADGSTVYVVRGNSVLKSTDGGSTWREMPLR